MIWFYERGADTLRIETRFNNTTRTYELVWHDPDGSQRLETFESEGAFRTRAEQVEASLLDDHWRPAGPPHLLRDGWKVG